MNDSRRPGVEEHFDDYARTGRWQALYQGINRKNFPFLLRLHWYRDRLRERAPASVLDIGCGSGDFIGALPRGTRRYLGLDLSAKMVDATRAVIAQLPAGRRGNFDAVQASFLEYAGKERFQFVIASGLIEYFEELPPVVARFADAIEPDGCVAVQVPNREFFRWQGVALADEQDKGFRHHRISGEECDRLMRDAGYDKLRGDYINHFYWRFSGRLPRLHILLDKLLRGVTPRAVSRRRASMYCGLYRLRSPDHG